MATGTADLAPAPRLVVSCGDLIGKPFEYGGRGPDFFDCYGLVTEFMRRAGQRVPDYISREAQERIALDMEAARVSWMACEPGPGAVALIRVGRHVCHVAIVMPRGKLMHTWARSGGVCIEDLDEWRHRITGFYRFPQ
jgi:cell wall-associated NlpC family hydrolase